MCMKWGCTNRLTAQLCAHVGRTEVLHYKARSFYTTMVARILMR